METNEFKKMFGEIAKENGFERAFEGWFKEAPEVIHALDLQKSNYGKYYYLNIKLYIHGVFENRYIKSKKLVKTDVGNVDERMPNNYSHLLNLDIPLENDVRMDGLRKMFANFVVPFCNKTSTRQGIIELNQKDELFIFPAVKKELGI